MTRSYLLGLLTLMTGSMLFYGDSLSAAGATWKAGLAKAKITPEKSMWLAGYGARRKPSEGTLHDIWVKALALEDADGQSAVVLSADLLGFPRKMYDRLSAAIEDRCGLDRSRIMLSASHTHTGPVLHEALPDIYPLDDQQKQLIEEYSAGLEKTIVETIAAAMARRTPAVLWAAEGKTAFAVNRRNNPERKVPELLKNGKLKGPVDHGVPVLAVRTPGGELRAVVFGYSCHATTLSFYNWSGDYPGFTQIALERNHPGAQAMFFQGCGADQNPLPRRTVELCRNYGEMLAAAVDEVLNKPMRPVAPRLRTAFELVTLDFGRQPTRSELQSAAKGKSYQGRWARRLIGQLDEGKTFAKNYPYPVQVWRLGSDQLWIALGGEVVVDYSLMFKSKYGLRTWVAGYVNDCPAYIPSRRVRKEGGYEAGAFTVYGLPAHEWAPGIEARITASVERLVQKTK